MAKNNIEPSKIAESSVKNMPVSPRRVQLVANFIRGKKAKESIDFLTFDSRKASRYILQLVKSAISNAQSKDSTAVDDLYILDVNVGQGTVLKNRGVPGAKGQFKPMKRRTTNLRIFIGKKGLNNE